MRAALRSPWIAVAALAVLTWVTFWPLVGHDFDEYDDVKYVTRNPHVQHGLTGDGIRWALTSFYASNWHPLTWMSHMLDWELFGARPAGHHAVSLLLHLANACLLFLGLDAMTGARGRSLTASALFAVHPLHVESVAWIAERKDVLSTLFWMLATLAYVRYVRSPSRARMALVAVLFAAGLAAKPMLVTLPFVLLLLDAWPLGRRGAPFLLREKLPLFALAAVSCAVTLAAQRGAIGTTEAYPLAARAANALVAYATYLLKALWPANLAVFYPYAPRSLGAPGVILSALVLAAATAGAYFLRRARPYAWTGWLWYLGTLVPVIGIVQVGLQSSADRYTYVPLVGIFVIVAWGVPELAARWRLAARAIPVAAAVAVGACAVAARVQVGYWRDGFTLWDHALAVDPGNYYAHTGVAIAAADAGRAEEASRHFAEAIRIAPDYAEAYHGWGLLLAHQGRLDEAITRYDAAVRLKPDFVAAQNNLGAALASAGRFADAASHYREALRLVPDDPTVRANLGQALARQGRLDEAVAELDRALRLDPRMAAAHDALGLALFQLGRADEAIAHYREALRLDPTSVGPRNNLALALSARDETNEAIAEYREALRIDPKNAEVHNNLGFALAAQGRAEEAIPHFREAIRLKPDFEMAHQCLALALGGTGRFEEAAAEFKEVLRLNPNNENARRGLGRLSGVLPARDGR